MINWEITFGNLLTIIAMVVTVVGWFFYQRGKIDGKVDKAEFNQFKMYVVRDYVSVSHLEKVETRMTAGMEMLAHEIRGLRSDILALYKHRTGRQS